VYEQLGGFQVRRGRFAPGDAGTYQTLALMRRLAMEGSRRVDVREAAISIVREAGVPPHEPLGELRALYDFVRDRVRFTRDADGIEVLQGPHYTLHILAGDCDDRAILLAALAKAIGIPAEFKFRVIGANPRVPGAFSHVYVVAKLGGREIPMDPTYAENPIGFEHPHPSRVGELTI